ncbi:MAG TPA: hypothetical protein VHT75_02905 [Acidimicrobiales bacterium]|jgi:hypothetical protein|nr:hypothetical protein [Acidimicrobiales bacterium]
MNMKLRAPIAAAMFALVAGCGSASPAARPRPSTNAKLLILSPTPNQVTGPNLTLQFQVTGGTVLPPAQATGPLRGDQGHIHVSVDGKLVQMAYSTHADLNGLSPGPHSVSASWVATDHLPFTNRVVADVLFTVQ